MPVPPSSSSKRSQVRVTVIWWAWAMSWASTSPCWGVKSVKPSSHRSMSWAQGQAESFSAVRVSRSRGSRAQFVPLRTFHLLPRLEEQLRLDTAAFQLVHRGQQVFQKGGTAGGPGVHGQLLGHRLYRLVHKQQPSAAVQFRLSHASRGQEHPVGKAAEGQHLGVQGYLVPPCLTKGTLGLVGLLLRDHQHLPPLLARLAQALQHRGGLAAARPA